MKRLILIHGYVEDPTIFDQLTPLLPPVNILRIDVEAEFRRWPLGAPVNGYTVAEWLVKAYTIAAGDVVIGHSMGGWISINIKAITGATVVQIASFTNQRRVVSPVYHHGLIKFVADLGLLQTRPSVRFVKRTYPFEESRALNFMFLDRVGTMPKAYISWQMSVLFAPVPPLTVAPDLRVHAEADNIVRPPDEPYIVVPGDHFCLVFHAPEVAKAINALFVERGYLTPGNPAASLPRLCD